MECERYGVTSRGAFITEIDGERVCEDCAPTGDCERCGRETDQLKLSGTYRCEDCRDHARRHDEVFTLMGYVTGFDLNVPLGERIKITLTQHVTWDDNYDTTENKAIWEVYITEDGNMVLDEENSRLTR